MPNEQRALKVFLCHASSDKPKVRELYRYLRRRGIKPWFDEVDLVGGQDWQVEIPKALATSDAIVICLTKNSVDKEGYIQKEIKFALDKALEMPEGRIFLIPVRFEECEVPFSLSRYQWVDLFNETGYSRMMRALKFRASQLERAIVQLPKKDIEEDKLALETAKREKEEHEVAEKAVQETAEREKVVKDDAKKARLDAEELVSQKNVRENKTPKDLNKIVIGVVVSVVLVLALIFGLPSLIGGPEPTPVATFTKSPALTLTPSVSVSTSTKIPTKGTTKTPIITQTTSVVELTKTSQKDGAIMILVPSSGKTDSFWIDQKAISVSMFRKFVEETRYITDAEKNGVGFVWMYLGAVSSTQYPDLTGVSYGLKLKSGVNWMAPYSDDMYANWTFPYTPPPKEYSDNDNVLQVSWNDANAYCVWAGKDLPLQEEWSLAIHNELYKSGTTKGEWGYDKVSRVSRIVFGVGFGDDGFVEYRSADIITFRCKE
jgi:hypothetical protein